jgi:hypothetical protein
LSATCGADGGSPCATTDDIVRAATACAAQKG